MIRNKSASEYDRMPPPQPNKTDPMSHRIIEKRRRDRMNNCLADLSRLIPAEYLKKGRGRVEKTEIIEMAIKHMQYLQSRASLAAGIDCSPGDLRVAKCEQSPGSDREAMPETVSMPTSPPAEGAIRPVVRPIVTEHYRLGYQECLSEAMHFLVEVEGYFAGDSLCVKLINHLQKHCDRIVKDDRLNFPRTRQPGETTSSSGSSSSYGAAGGRSGSGGSSGGANKASTTSASAMGAEEQQTTNMAASQLRDILCSSPPLHPNPHHQYQLGLPVGALPHYDASPEETTPAEGLQPYPEGALDGMHSDQHQHHHSYKFKNNIKQRFSEEHSGLKRRRMTSSPPPTPPSGSHSSQQNSVPIFVLHTKGAFYIPLTVSYEVLAPYLDMDFLSDASASSGRSTGTGLSSSLLPPGVVLHPVTISVNFQQCLKPPPPPPTPHALPPAVPPTRTSATQAWLRTDPAGNFLAVAPWGEICAAAPTRQ